MEIHPGIIEVPSFKKVTINIGRRQLGRVQAKSIINCKETSEAIVDAIKFLYSEKYQEELIQVENPYKGENTSQKIINILASIDTTELIRKSFYDIEDRRVI